jgi:hypothetical protein
MNPVVTAALSSILRWVLALGAGYLVKAGIWTGSDAQTYVAAGALGLLSLVWSQWDKITSRIQFLTALSRGPSTEAAVNQHIAMGLPTPTVFTPPSTIPGVPVPPELPPPGKYRS